MSERVSLYNTILPKAMKLVDSHSLTIIQTERFQLRLIATFKFFSISKQTIVTNQ